MNQAQKAYERFDRRSKLIAAALGAAGLICLTLTLVFEHLDDLIPMLLSFAGLVIWFIAFIIVVAKLNEIRRILYHRAYGRDEQPVHTGVFKELMEEFERNRFEGLTDGKVIFAEAHSNSIELELRRKRRAFHIVIDPGAVFIVVEEESAKPQEYEFPLSDFDNISEIFTAIRGVVQHP